MDVPKIGIKFGFSLERICEKERRKKKRDRVSKKFYNIQNSETQEEEF